VIIDYRQQVDDLMQGYYTTPEKSSLRIHT